MLWVVTKSDTDMDAPYVIGVFTDRVLADAACIGPGTFHVAGCRENRIYRRGDLLDVTVVENVTTYSLRTTP
jgi:hypothetical protein